MDTPIEEIIKNIIHIDKSAIIMRENLEDQIRERRSRVEGEIEKLRNEIVGTEVQRVEEMKNREIEEYESAAYEIKKKSTEKCSVMYETFLKRREKLVEDIFKELFINKKSL